MAWLDARLSDAAYCVQTSVHCDEFRVLTDLAMRSQGYKVSGLADLRNRADRTKVELSGCEFRLLLMLARQALRANLRPKLRLVPSNVIPLRRVSRG